MSRKRRSKRYSKHSKTHITRNMYRKKHKKTQRGGGAQKIGPFKAAPEGYIPPGPAIPIPHGVAWYIQDKVYRPIPDKVVMPIQDNFDVPADFLPEGWKRIYSEEDHRPFILTPGCSSVYTPGSKKLTDILEYYYRTSTHSKVPPKLPTLHESPKSPKSSTSHESPKSPDSHKSPKSSKYSKSK